MQKLPVWIFSFGLFPLGLGGVVLGGADILDGIKSRGWNQAPGMVLSSQLEPQFFAPWQPDVRYSYFVGTSPFVSDRIWPGKTFAYMPELTVSASRRIVEQFPERRSVTVYVNPQNPLDAALVPGPRKAYVWMAIFLFFLSLGFWSPLALGLVWEKRLTKSD